MLPPRPWTLGAPAAEVAADLFPSLCSAAEAARIWLLGDEALGDEALGDFEERREK